MNIEREARIALDKVLQQTETALIAAEAARRLFDEYAMNYGDTMRFGLLNAAAHKGVDNAIEYTVQNLQQANCIMNVKIDESKDRERGQRVFDDAMTQSAYDFGN